MAKKRVGGYQRHTPEFRKMAVERLKSCDNVLALAEELGVHRRLLYNCLYIYRALELWARTTGG